MRTDILTCRRGRRGDGQECLDFALCTLHFSLGTPLEHANCHSDVGPVSPAFGLLRRINWPVKPALRDYVTGKPSAGVHKDEIIHDE